jgi:NAD(P)-dependent dehydrogenase (short-subunit alcohol dehydrogenase family)
VETLKTHSPAPQGPRQRLTDKVAIVTGAGRGIGRACALGLAAEGAHVVLADVDVQSAAETAGEIIATNRRAVSLKVDVTSLDDVRNMVSRAVQEFSRIDILINNAGIVGPSRSEDLSEEEWDRVISVNLKGVFLCSQAVGRQMIAQKCGSIVSISSIAAWAAFPMRASYCASKAGVIALTQVLACEWAQHGIRINAVGPGYVLTEAVRETVRRGVTTLSDVRHRTPLGRLGETDEIARAVVFLASDEASYITGQNLFVDGGWTAFGLWTDQSTSRA